MKKFIFPFISAIVLLLLGTGNLFAWQIGFASDQHFPEEFIAVDKNRQELFVLANRSPLQKVLTLSCSTGQSHEDKQREGDLRTPEGVYFVEVLIRDGLDFEMYGDRAFTLNYPNPVDRVRRKTGSGIWIHGKGSEIEPFDSRGCVVLNMDNIKKLSSEISLRLTPVVIARGIDWNRKNDNQASLERLVQLTNRWAETWSKKSDKYFQHYNPEKFSIGSQNSFTYFKNRKKRLFNSYPWIDVFVYNPKAIEGPGYWVSYFGQLYRTPTFTSAGVKRLYWMQDDKGEFKIVGEEWRPWPKGNLQSEYIRNRRPLLEDWFYQWLNAWREADLQEYIRFYDRDAEQGPRTGKENIFAQKDRIWNEGLKPETIDVRNLRINMHPQGFLLTFEQEYSNIQGYHDRGIKEIICIPYGSEWLIVQETWTSL